MYHFAVVALLGLATFAVVRLVEDLMPDMVRFRSLLTFVLGVAAAFALDYSMFRGFSIHVREAWLGTAATGLVIGAMAWVWRAVLGYLGAGERPVAAGDTRRPRVAA